MGWLHHPSILPSSIYRLQTLKTTRFLRSSHAEAVRTEIGRSPMGTSEGRSLVKAS
ncbi:hypothetical protein [Vacuolonema iberomarrocanum]|uniref:hypothetical protein n=1 Tax=Vacuolonema iberomarrocanum TaxID=3454632 RepID=UPI0019E62FCB|nr:hypothetical protein [filamentous cyanobacterium LEGE 07170]